VVGVCAATSASFAGYKTPLEHPVSGRERYQEQHGKGLQVAVGRVIITRDLHSTHNIPHHQMRDVTSWPALSAYQASMLRPDKLAL
jgi:hypothetical protein